MHWLQNKREEMSKDISCHLRALKLLFCYNREWALVGLTILMDSLSPFVVIYLSSMLLEALYEQRPIREMLVWAAAGAGAALFINVVRHWAAKHKNVMWWGLQYRMAEPVLMKTMGMDYELTENEEVRAMRSRQEEYRKRNIGAFEVFIRFMQQLLTAFLKQVIAVATILPLFVSQAAHRRQETPFVFRMTVLTGLLLIMGFVLIQKAVRRKDRKKYAITQTVIEKNRLNEYMMEKVVLSTEAGKDIRIFHQEKLMEEYGDNMTSGWRNAAKQLAGQRRKMGWYPGLSFCLYRRDSLSLHRDMRLCGRNCSGQCCQICRCDPAAHPGFNRFDERVDAAAQKPGGNGGVSGIPGSEGCEEKGNHSRGKKKGRQIPDRVQKCFLPLSGYGKICT